MHLNKEQVEELDYIFIMAVAVCLGYQGRLALAGLHKSSDTVLELKDRISKFREATTKLELKKNEQSEPSA